MPRLRSIVVQLLGKFFFLRMEGEEWLKRRDKVIVRGENVHTIEEMEKFLAEQTKLLLDLENTACYKIYLFPDFSQNESKIVLVVNHIITDGVSGMSVLALLQPNQDFSGLMKVSPASYYVQILHTLIAPFTVPLIFRKYRTIKPKTTCIQQVDIPSKERYVKVWDTVTLEDVKKVSKHHGVTFNIIVQAFLSQTLAEYFKRRGDTKTTDVTFSNAFSLRPFPTKASEFKMENNSVM